MECSAALFNPSVTDRSAVQFSLSVSGSEQTLMYLLIQRPFLCSLSEALLQRLYWRIYVRYSSLNIETKTGRHLTPESRNDLSSPIIDGTGGYRLHGKIYRQRANPMTDSIFRAKDSYNLTASQSLLLNSHYTASVHHTVYQTSSTYDLMNAEFNRVKQSYF